MRYSRHQGFTLLEILLVVLLMGLAASAVTFTLGNTDKKQELTRVAQKFMATTELVLDETVLSGHFIGIIVDDDRYRFVVYHEDKWQPLESDRMLGEVQMEPEISLALVLEGLPLVQEDEEDESWFDEPFIEETDSEKKKNPEPQIMLFPSGEMTGFELAFITKDENNQNIEVQVVGTALGRLTIGRPDA